MRHSARRLLCALVLAAAAVAATASVAGAWTAGPPFSVTTFATPVTFPSSSAASVHGVSLGLDGVSDDTTCTFALWDAFLTTPLAPPEVTCADNARVSGGFIRLRLRQSLTNEDMGEGDFGAELPDWRRLTKRQIKY